MTFSVIVPAYNCADTLAETVASIRASGLEEYEIILVDDGSVDSTPEVCRALCEAYPEVHSIRQENRGVSAARNRGIDCAGGEYLLFFDADDFVEKESLRQAGRLVQQEKPDLLIFGMRFDYYRNGTCYRSDALVPPCSGEISGESLRERFQDFYTQNALTPVWNKFYRREILQQHALKFREGMILMEDFLFVLDVLPFCNRIYCLPEPIYRYRQGEDEKNAYRRLQRIPDLAAYLQPFEESIARLQLRNGETFVAEHLYRMLLQQKLYYASRKEIGRELALHQQGPYRDLDAGGTPTRIWLKNQKTQLRHQLAVRVKAWLKQ